MKINQKILDQIFAHAEKEGENEACGVLILVKGKMQYRPCKNISDTPMFTFSIDPYDHADAEDAGDIIAYVHSHPRSQPTPSWADKEGIEQTGLPWVIVNWRTRTHTINNPDGWVTPLKGREFIHGIHDCYGLIRDYYKQERGIILPDFERKHQWWLRGDNLFVENFTKAGFKQIPFDQLSEGDVLILQLAATVPNHGAIYVGNNRMLHHMTGRLSSEDIYGGAWLKCTTHCLRYANA